MKITWNDLRIFPSIENSKDLFESWYWLIGTDKSVVLITSIGDAIMKNEADTFFWLNVGEGIFSEIAKSQQDFDSKLSDDNFMDELFLPNLVEEIKTAGLEMRKGSIFGFKKLPIIGGEYDPENFETTDINVHFYLTGQIHEQIRNLPDGTKVKITSKGK